MICRLIGGLSLTAWILKSDKDRIVGIKNTGAGTQSRDNAIRDILPFVEWGFLVGLFDTHFESPIPFLPQHGSNVFSVT